MRLQGLHDEQDRVAPEWESILQQLRAAAPALDRLGAQAREQQRRAQPWANATQAIAAGVAELSGLLPVATRWDATTGQLLVGAHVHFPGLVAPRRAAAAAGRLAALSAPQAAANASAEAGGIGDSAAGRRARRMALQRAAQDAGAAAAADWAPLLAQRFGARLQRAGADSAVALVPAGQLDAALQWLARRPAVHWVAPAPRLRLNNKRVTVIAQVGGSLSFQLRPFVLSVSPALAIFVVLVACARGLHAACVAELPSCAQRTAKGQNCSRFAGFWAGAPHAQPVPLAWAAPRRLAVPALEAAAPLSSPDAHVTFPPPPPNKTYI